MPVSYRILPAKVACTPELQEKSATLKVEIKILPADNGTRGQRATPRSDSRTPFPITVHEARKIRFSPGSPPEPKSHTGLRGPEERQDHQAQEKLGRGQEVAKVGA